jgi:hypothetical protein
MNNEGSDAQALPIEEPLREDPADAQVARADAVDAVIAGLLANHTEAVFYAIGPDGIIVPMPQSIDLEGHVMGHAISALDMVIPEHRAVVIDAWERVRKSGHATARVRLTSERDRRVVLHFFDAQVRHGVYIGAFTSDERPEEVLISQEAVVRKPRFACAHKNELAVLLEIDEAFAQILGWTPKRSSGFGPSISSTQTTRRSRSTTGWTWWPHTAQATG